MNKQLVRSKTNKIIAGVCGGVAERLGVQADVVRLATVLAAVFTSGTAILVYLALSFILPENNTDEYYEI